MNHDVQRGAAALGLLAGTLQACGGYELPTGGPGRTVGAPQEELSSHYTVQGLMVADGHCLRLSLPPEPTTGIVPAIVVEASSVDSHREGACNACDSPGREPIAPESPALDAILAYPMPRSDGGEGAAMADRFGWNCYCEVTQLAGAIGQECLTAPRGTATLWEGETLKGDGWCYIDATTAPAIGNPEVVGQCPETAARTIRFAGKGVAREGTSLLLLSVD